MASQVKLTMKANHYQCPKCGKWVAFNFVYHAGHTTYNKLVEWNKDFTGYRPHICKGRGAWEDEK